MIKVTTHTYNGAVYVLELPGDVNAKDRVALVLDDVARTSKGFVQVTEVKFIRCQEVKEVDVEMIEEEEQLPLPTDEKVGGTD